MKRIELLVLAVLFLAGCGVSKEKYNELRRERDKLRDQVTVLTKEKGDLEKEKETVKEELAESRSKLAEALGEKSALREEYDRLVDIKISLKNDHDRLLREKQVLESRIFELEKQSQPNQP